MDVQTPNCVCLNSQTACAEMALRILGIGKGDEVIVPAYTYTASASVVNHVGAKIVFVDVQKDCLEMDYVAVEAAITENTKAIIPVDLGGIPCDYDRLMEIVKRKKDLFRPKTDLQKEDWSYSNLFGLCTLFFWRLSHQRRKESDVWSNGRFLII